MRQASTDVIRQIKSFNSRTREGCDVSVEILGAVERSFQFTHPGGVRLDVEVVPALCNEFQFTHPGGVRLDISEVVTTALTVSIHAPGRGAT